MDRLNYNVKITTRKQIAVYDKHSIRKNKKKKKNPNEKKSFFTLFKEVLFGDVHWL